MHAADEAACLFAEVVVAHALAVRSGPRKTIYHNPKDVVAAIVTCEQAGMGAALLWLLSALGSCSKDSGAA